MSETAFKVNAILKEVFSQDKAESLTILIEDLSKSNAKEYLTQSDKIDLIDRINKVEKNIISRLYVALGLAVTIITLAIKYL